MFSKNLKERNPSSSAELGFGSMTPDPSKSYESLWIQIEGSVKQR
jgi:hypothetical protein